MSSQDRDILSNEVKPISYNIRLFDLELGGSFAFHGDVSIDVDIKAAVQSITLNAHELEVQSAVIDGKYVHGRPNLHFSYLGIVDVSQQMMFLMTEALSVLPWAFRRRLAHRRPLSISGTKVP